MNERGGGEMGVYYSIEKDLVRSREPFEVGGVRYVPERTCKVVGPKYYEGFMNVWKCLGCERMFVSFSERPNYCPNCGSKVVER